MGIMLGSTSRRERRREVRVRASIGCGARILVGRRCGGGGDNGGERERSLGIELGRREWGLRRAWCGEGAVSD